MHLRVLRGKCLNPDKHGAASVYVRYPHKMRGGFPTRGDQKLIQIVDSALADATRRSGKWLACRPGCTQCCIGAFAINQLDALRLQPRPRRLGKASTRSVPRASASVHANPLPGCRRSSLAIPSLACCTKGKTRSNSSPTLPTMSPARCSIPRQGLCELYESRPMTCRVFGPPVRSEDGLGVCELCFQGASDKEIAACEMKPDPDDLESRLLEQLEKSTGKRGETIIAFCLAS